MQNVALPFECAFPSLWYQGQKRQNDVVTSVGLLPRFSYIVFFFPHYSFASIHLRPIPSFACGFRALLFCLRPSCASLLPVAFACIHSSASFIYRLFLSHHGFFFPMHLPLVRFLLAWGLRGYFTYPPFSELNVKACIYFLREIAKKGHVTFWIFFQEGICTFFMESRSFKGNPTFFWRKTRGGGERIHRPF